MELARPLAHSYVLQVVAQFQGFVRDLHDLGARRLVALAQTAATAEPLLIAAATEGRAIDRGNADMRSITSDFARLGVTKLADQIAAHNKHWKGSEQKPKDAQHLNALIDLRNGLAHGDRNKLVRLRAKDVLDSVTWTRDRLPALTRTAKALDHIVWDHLYSTFGQEPW